MNKTKRRTIGFFIDWIENPYQRSLYSGIKDQAFKKDINILTFVGGAIDSPRKHEQLKNSIYQVVNKDNIDGLIISAGSVCRYVDNARYKEYLQQFHDIPVVSICQKVEGIHSILIDNNSGLYKMMLHLIRDHGYKKFAFIRGPKGNFDADIRLNAYKQTLKEFQIPFDEKLIYYGDFTSNSGVEAVRSLIKNHKIDVDIIFAANDDMAFGVIEELQKMNFVIPRDIAVIGFDDQTSSKIINPPLTTVRQPIYETGVKALDIIVDIINNKETPMEIYLETEPIIRESYGCNEESLSQNSVSLTELEEIITKEKKPEILINQFEKLSELIQNNVLNQTSHQPDFDSQYIKLEDIDELLHALFSSYHAHNHQPFLSVLKSLLYKAGSFTRNKQILWQIFISVLRSHILPFLSVSKQQLTENILHKARLLIDDYSDREYMLRALKEEQAYQLFRDIGEHIISLESMDDVLKILGETFPRLGIQSCYLSLYKGKETDISQLSHSTLLFAVSPGGRIPIGPEGISFPTRKLFPDNIIPDDKPFSLLVESLFFGKNQLGIVLYEPGSQKSFTLEIMRRLLLNSALKGAAFIHQIQNQSHHLEKANSELHKTLDTLQATQKSLVETRKMAALGRLVAGIAHEINTPIGIGVTAASHLLKETENVLIKMQTMELKKSDLEKYITIANEASSMILSNLKRSRELLESFKDIAVDQSSEKKRSFRIKSYIHDILLSLRPKLKQVNHSIDVQCSDTIEIHSYPGAFSQIITNLLLNSIIHAFDQADKGIITIKIEHKDKKLYITYSDNGKGIAREHLSRIFDPFFTTKRARGGTGLGLHLIYNIITQTLKGTIKCESTPGTGTTFYINLPTQ